MDRHEYDTEERKIFRKLNLPKKIQDYLNSIEFNFQEGKEIIIMSPRMFLKSKKANCIEGAILASAILEFHGQKPLIMDLRVGPKPFDSVFRSVASAKNSCTILLSYADIGSTSMFDLKYLALSAIMCATARMFSTRFF